MQDLDGRDPREAFGLMQLANQAFEPVGASSECQR
jgi:hypothetical protein